MSETLSLLEAMQRSKETGASFASEELPGDFVYGPGGQMINNHGVACDVTIEKLRARWFMIEPKIAITRSQFEGAVQVEAANSVYWSESVWGRIWNRLKQTTEWS